MYLENNEKNAFTFEWPECRVIQIYTVLQYHVLFEIHENLIRLCAYNSTEVRRYYRNTHETQTEIDINAV